MQRLMVDDAEENGRMKALTSSPPREFTQATPSRSPRSEEKTP
jgi:hypothetical protein